MWNEKDLIQFIEARDCVVDAINALAKVEETKRAAERETVRHFISGLRDWLSCDHGEAGFVPFTRNVLRKVR